MQQIYLDSFHLHSLDSSIPYFVHANIQGIDSPSIRLDSYNNPGANGQTTANAFLGGRLIVLQGTVGAEDINTYRTARQSLSELAVPIKDADARLVPRTLSFTDLAGNTFEIDCVVSSFECADTYPLHSEWQMQLVATDHRIYGTTLNSLSISLAISGGYSFPYDFPYDFGSSSGGVGSANNAGTIATSPVITFYGPMSNPRLINLTTGETMALTLDLVLGDVVTVDMAKRTIIQGSSTNRMGFMTNDSRFWSLDPGENQLSFSAASYDAGTVEIQWRSAFTGR